MSTQFLTTEEKARGVKHHYLHQNFNGAGFNFLGDTPVYLLAIHYGATNTQLGYISSTIFITGMLLSVIPRLFSGKNMVKLQFWAWLFRGLVCLGYSALFFIEGQSAVVLILTIYTLFCSFRVIGVVVYQPLMKMLTTNRNRGTVLSKSTVSFHMILSISRVVSFVVTSIKQLAGPVGIIMLQWVGILFNTLSAFQMRKIPCRQNIEYTPGRNVFNILSEALKNREFRYCMLLNWTNTSLMVVFGFIIPFLRREVGINTNLIFLYTLAVGLASVSAGLYSQGFADRIGSRPIILGSSLLLSLCTLLWLLTPADIGIAFYFIFGFLTTFSLFINMVMTNRLVVRSMPENDTVGYSTMLNFFSGIIAFLIGIGAGILADFSNKVGDILPNGYSLPFFLAFLLTLLTFFLTWKIKDAGSLSPRKAASIMFSLTNLATYQRIGQLRKTIDPTEKKALILRLGNDKTIMAEEEIKSFLHNPLAIEKEEAILSLYSNPRPRLLPDLLKEASDPGSYHRVRAVFALGAYPDRKNEELLTKLLNDPNPSIRSNAAKSLGRIGACSSLETVRNLAEKETEILEHLNYIIALKHMDTEGVYLKELFNEKVTARGKSYTQSHYSLHARLLGFTPSLSEIFHSRNMAQGQGLQDFLDEARDDEGFLASHSELMGWFKGAEYGRIWERCRNILSKKKHSAYYENMKESLRGFPLSKAGYDETLAAVYFTYQLIKIHPDEGYIQIQG
ncbi:MAG: HEAT repeat domain-containing protein [Spirochaetales bacterium]|nr:HEAT repeat domain-containing protein [Spirochaetales bacterium]